MVTYTMGKVYEGLIKPWDGNSSYYQVTNCVNNLCLFEAILDLYHKQFFSKFLCHRHTELNWFQDLFPWEGH